MISVVGDSLVQLLGVCNWTCTVLVVAKTLLTSCTQLQICREETLMELVSGCVDALDV